jgi:hypothetical protein
MTYEPIGLLLCFSPPFPVKHSCFIFLTSNRTRHQTHLQPEPALRIGAALEADARRRTAARHSGAPHRQASVLRDGDRAALAALLPPALAPRLPALPGGGGAGSAKSSGKPAAAGAAGALGWLQRRSRGKAGAGAAAAAQQQQQEQLQQLRYGGLAGVLLDLIDSILVLDAVHRPDLDELTRRVRRVMASLG